MALFNQGHCEQAIQHFQRATEIDPEYGEAYLYLGRCYLSLGKWHAALSPLRTALRLAPAETKREIISILIDALFGAATYEFKKGNFQTAVGFLREGLALQPESGKLKSELFSTLLALGGQFLKDKNPKEAITAFSEAVKLSPADYRGYLGLARSFFQNRDFQKAIHALKDAIGLEPTNKEAQKLLRELLAQ
jgi:tetratricopeptide (TPR) repeat protein